MIFQSILRSRKGMDPFKLLLLMTVGVIFLVVMIIFAMTIVENTEKQAARTHCQASVISYAKLNSVPFDSVLRDSGEIDCPTQFLTIADARGDVMRREIANLMYDCWSNYGAGNMLLFDDSGDKFCMICSVFDFEDKSENLTGMASFLMNERVPREITKGVQPTYYEYFTSSVVPAGILEQIVSKNVLSGSQNYAVVFTFYEKGFMDTMLGFFADVSGALGMDETAKFYPMMVGASADPFNDDNRGDYLETLKTSFGGGIIFSKKVTDDWFSHIILVPYTGQHLKALGCNELPISQVDKKYRY